MFSFNKYSLSSVYMPDIVLVAREMTVSSIKFLLTGVFHLFRGNRIIAKQANHILGAKDTKRERIKVMVKCCDRQNYKMVPKIPASGYTV